MSGLQTTRHREHHWVEYDDTHRSCSLCGLRLFFRSGGILGAGWTLLDWRGVPTVTRLLGDGRGDFGACSPPPRPPIAESVIIEYTGDPDAYPGCERFMHRLPFAHRESSELVSLGSIVPECGWQCTWWEVGPARDYHGWTWCADCWNGKGSSRRSYVPVGGAPPPTLEKREPRALASGPVRLLPEAASSSRGGIVRVSRELPPPRELPAGKLTTTRKRRKE